MAQSGMPGRRIVILIGLLLTVVVPPLGLGHYAMSIPGIPPWAGQEAFWWTLVTVVLLYVLAVERRPLSSIGLHRPTWKTLAFGVGGAAAVMALGALVLFLVLPRLHLQQNGATLKHMLEMPYWLRFAIVTRAAVCEEILLRGYAIERIEELSGSRLLAGAVTLAVFTFGHWSYGTLAQFFLAGAAGLVLTILYIWRRDLGANIVAHWIVDGLSLLTQ